MTSQSYRPTTATALIVTPDPLGGALLGAAAELAGVRPVFPRQHESPRAAVRRARPAYVLIDCDHDSAADGALLGPALMLGARVLLFGSAERVQALRHLVIRYRVGMIVLPRDADHVREILTPLESERRHVER